MGAEPGAIHPSGNTTASRSTACAPFAITCPTPATAVACVLGALGFVLPLVGPRIAETTRAVRHAPPLP
ncbi:hypothetical protein StrepF001_30605 [Streptomyces sp. F001]|uniref:hypothetical protein n=1 Tax=Streptomyces sp. F001 TaxID=1510026 RepID=UPI00101E28C5|nr:hypothetical protein [Streptomyces sp. F001]RZB15725.1 hypothetical protein StrepF001_30605 [Streptomyces sp. F001]